MSSSSAALPNLPATSSNGASSAQQTSASASASASSQQSASASSSRQTGSVSSASGLPQIGASSTVTSLTDTSSSSISGITGAPSLTSSDIDGPILSLTGLPTLSGAYSYPPASVPPTQNAPYMRQSHLPQNFVFIVVGAFLALILVMVVLWRSLTAWSINRSFKKDSAAAYTPLPDIKKRQSGHMNESMVDMADLSGTNNSSAKLPKSFNSVPSLFFSPTAEVARQSMIRPQSQHMPSGHYRDGSK